MFDDELLQDCKRKNEETVTLILSHLDERIVIVFDGFSDDGLYEEMSSMSYGGGFGRKSQNRVASAENAWRL